MKRSASGVAHHHFARLWAARNDDSSHVFADGSKPWHTFGKAERRSSLRMLIRMMRRERDIKGYTP